MLPTTGRPRFRARAGGARAGHPAHPPSCAAARQQGDRPERGTWNDDAHKAGVPGFVPM